MRRCHDDLRLTRVGSCVWVCMCGYIVCGYLCLDAGITWVLMCRVCVCVCVCVRACVHVIVDSHYRFYCGYRYVALQSGCGCPQNLSKHPNPTFE